MRLILCSLVPFFYACFDFDIVVFLCTVEITAPKFRDAHYVLGGEIGSFL